MTQPVIVIGAGGHGSVILDMLLHMNATVQGVTDANAPTNAQSNILGVPIIGNDDEVFKCEPATVTLALGVGIGTGDLREGIALRRTIYDRFVKAGYRFIALIHPAAVVGGHVDIAAGAQIMAGAVVQTGVTIGTNCIINTQATVDHDCEIGAHSHIAPGTVLGGGVVVGEAAHIGIGAVVVPNINIGDGVVIAAGAVVTQDVPPHVTVYGVPAKEKT